MDDFDRWMRRPVYVAQCFTASIYRSLGFPYMGLRLLRPYRSESDQKARDLTAYTVREMRRHGGLNRREVQRHHEMVLANPRGYCQRVDIDTELERMA